jgi:4-aminobutyrate aminotransferase-like enzyme
MVSTQSQTDTLLERDARALGNVLKVRFYPLAVERAQGCTITDVDGVEYLDFMAGWAVANTGYGHPGVVEPVMAQMQKTSFATLTALMNEPAITLAERLVALMPGDFERRPGSVSMAPMLLMRSRSLSRWRPNDRDWCRISAATTARPAARQHSVAIPRRHA